ncbi:MAG TPA: 4Fe-4S binding protein [Myxococcales bacterium]|jgi:ferredoxin
MAYRIIETCIGCTACVKRCPTDAITGDRKLLHIIDPALCIDCGACGVVCPTNAILDQYGNVQVLLKKTERPIAFVYEQACTGCEKCVERCPFEALEMVPVKDASSFLGIVSVIEKNCTGCRECEKACPYDAIFIYRKDRVPDWLKDSKVEKAA